MGYKKRKEADNSDGDEDIGHSASDADAPADTIKSKPLAMSKRPSSSKAKTVKKPKIDNSDGESREMGKQSANRALEDASGGKYVDLGKMRRATVRQFKGHVYLDIREYYVKEGTENPGKKGISLTKEQWEVLKRNICTLDSLFAEMI